MPAKHTLINSLVCISREMKAYVCVLLIYVCMPTFMCFSMCVCVFMPINASAVLCVCGMGFLVCCCVCVCVSVCVCTFVVGWVWWGRASTPCPLSTVGCGRLLVSSVCGGVC